MINIQLPNPSTEEFETLIPQQRAAINQLFLQRKIINYSLSLQSRLLWVVVPAKEISEVAVLLSTFPILRHIEYQIHELTFHNSVYAIAPHMSLN